MEPEYWLTIKFPEPVLVNDQLVAGPLYRKTISPEPLAGFEAVAEDTGETVTVQEPVPVICSSAAGLPRLLKPYPVTPE